MSRRQCLPRACMLGLLLAALASACASAPPAARPDALSRLPALKGDYFPLHSRHVGRDYHVFVRLPTDYQAGAGRRYPVVYLLDGDSLFPLLAPTHLFLHYDEKLPEAIIVGIAYGGFEPGVSNFRDVDYNVPTTGQPPDRTRGAAAFQRFLSDELLPAVEARFAADPARRVLLGQSRGGTFVLWNAQQMPDLFWGRIASNPGAGSGDPAFHADAHPAQSTRGQVIVASGARDSDTRRHAALAWTQAWGSRVDAPWTVALLPIENGTHAASIGEVYRRAMLALFKDEIAGAGAR